MPIILPIILVELVVGYWLSVAGYWCRKPFPVRVSSIVVPCGKICRNDSLAFLKKDFCQKNKKENEKAAAAEANNRRLALLFTFASSNTELFRSCCTLSEFLPPSFFVSSS
jgi:hypothetical protein